MTLSLFIDTTLLGASVGLLEGNNRWTGFCSERGDATLGKLVYQGLSTFGRTAKDISTIFVSHGPGSFTGIKVGLAWAYGFQAAREENLLVGMSSLEKGNTEMQKVFQNSKIALVLPISRREVFLSWKEEKHNFSSLVLFTKEAEEELNKIQDYNFYLISSESKTLEWMRSLNLKTNEIDMQRFMKIALEGMMNASDNLTEEKRKIVVPLYLKKTTVEEKLSLRNSNV